MESLGKRLDIDGQEVQQGLTVYGNKGSTDQHSFVQQLRDGRDDFFVHFVQVLDGGEATPLEREAGDSLQGFLLGTRRALTEQGRRSATITMDEVAAYTLGGLIALFERAVGHYGSLIRINAYHQPGVEAFKIAARDILVLGERLRSALTADVQSVEALAAQIDATVDETWYVLLRLAKTARVRQTTGGFALP